MRPIVTDANWDKVVTAFVDGGQQRHRVKIEEALMKRRGGFGSPRRFFRRI